MSGQRAKNNYRYKRVKARRRANRSGRVQEIPEIVPERRRVEFQSNRSVHGMC